MSKELIENLTQAGQLHKGTDLGGLLQWAVLHIQNLDEALKKDVEASASHTRGAK